MRLKGLYGQRTYSSTCLRNCAGTTAAGTDAQSLGSTVETSPSPANANSVAAGAAASDAAVQRAQAAGVRAASMSSLVPQPAPGTAAGQQLQAASAAGQNGQSSGGTTGGSGQSSPGSAAQDAGSANSGVLSGNTLESSGQTSPLTPYNTVSPLLDSPPLSRSACTALLESCAVALHYNHCCLQSSLNSFWNMSTFMRPP